MSFIAATGCRPVVEEFTCIRIADLRAAVGGRRRLRTASSCEVTLPDGRRATLALTRKPHGFGEQVRVICPRCRIGRRQLYVVPCDDVLICLHCLRVVFKAKFRSQLPRRMEARMCAE